jgi:hypothetical protein
MLAGSGNGLDEAATWGKPRGHGLTRSGAIGGVLACGALGGVDALAALACEVRRVARSFSDNGRLELVADRRRRAATIWEIFLAHLSPIWGVLRCGRICSSVVATVDLRVRYPMSAGASINYGMCVPGR